MKDILIIGAGRSATTLINYVLKKAKTHQWNVVVADANVELAKQKVATYDQASAVELDIKNVERRRQLISEAEVVVSMLPAFLHIEVARDCIMLKKHLMTASYVSKEMAELGEQARALGLIFMGEIGLDPGLDHMSAMQKIHEIEEMGGVLTSFQSYTGGLIAPESDDNPWHYKFTWNPRNVVLSGQGVARYLEDGVVKFVPYNRVFKNHKTTEIEGLGTYEVYANRNSLLYLKIYGLENIPSIFRGTIRHLGFCDAWNALIRIGLTDDAFSIADSANMTYRDLTEAYIPKGELPLENRVAAFLNEEVDSPIMKKLEWAGLCSDERIELNNASPAKILEKLLLKKWKLKPTDKDMIIMKHEFEYILNGRKELQTSTLVMEGEDQVHTAMAKLVGLPLGIFVKLVMEGEITSTKTSIPVVKEVYEPVLKELKEYGVEFVERTFSLEAVS